jgi:predicted metal-binding membrane protein
MQLEYKLPDRDYWTIGFALAGMTLLSWYYLISMAHGLPAGLECCMLPIKNWDFNYFKMVFIMWTIMMIGMMLPSAVPMTMIYAAVARKAKKQGMPLASTWFFVGGYILMWTLFSLAATFIQWKLDQTALLSPLMASQNPKFGAGILIAAGIYQWLPVKDRCLTLCQSPFHFISRHWRQGNIGALRMGIDHGIYCIGCCWLLMLLLFVGGVMNLLWVGTIAVFILLEKILPFGRQGGKWAGFMMIVIGMIILIMKA